MRRPIRSGVVGLAFTGISILLILSGMLTLALQGMEIPAVLNALLTSLITGMFAFMQHPTSEDKAADAAAQETNP